MAKRRVASSAAADSAAAQAEHDTLFSGAPEVAPEVARPSSAREVAPEVVTIDLAHPNARKQLEAAFPRVLEETSRDATPAEDEAARAYLATRDEVARLEGIKESCGNVLRFGIKSTHAIDGDGWRATWGEREGQVDWRAVLVEVTALLGPDAQATLSRIIASKRGPTGRTLLVTAKGDKK